MEIHFRPRDPESDVHARQVLLHGLLADTRVIEFHVIGSFLIQGVILATEASSERPNLSVKVRVTGSEHSPERVGDAIWIDFDSIDEMVIL